MRFFYMHVGSFVAVIVYFTFAGGAEYSAAGVRTALTVALAVETVYVWLARRAGELKHFDVGLWLLFATGTPSGVGSTRDPRRYLKEGEEIVSRIEGIGTMVNRCVAPRAAD